MYEEGSAQERMAGRLNECVEYLSTIAGQLEMLNYAQRYAYVTESGSDWSVLYRIERATGRIWVLKHIHENWAHDDLPQKRWEPLNIEPEG